jgi:hypothetical protein
MALRKFDQMDVEEYLLWESEQEVRHELVDGVPQLMVGGTLGHDVVKTIALPCSFIRCEDSLPQRQHPLSGHYDRLRPCGANRSHAQRPPRRLRGSVTQYADNRFSHQASRLQDNPHAHGLCHPVAGRAKIACLSQNWRRLDRRGDRGDGRYHPAARDRHRAAARRSLRGPSVGQAAITIAETSRP